MVYTQDNLPQPVLMHLTADQLTPEILAEHVPTSPLQTTLVVAATKINTALDERRVRLLATPRILAIESNYGISKINSNILDLRKPCKRTKKREKKKKPTSSSQENTVVDKDMNIITRTIVTGKYIEQYMNACVQYNVLSDNGQIYRVKRYRTGRMQIPNVHDEHHASDAAEVVQHIIEYERKYCGLDATTIEPFHFNLLNYKFVLLMGWTIRLELVVAYFRKYLTERIAAAGGRIPVDIPFVEDEPLTRENIYILDINDTKGNSIIYVSIYIPSKSREVRQKSTTGDNAEDADDIDSSDDEPLDAPGVKKRIPKDHQKNITVSISHNGLCNIQGGMENRQPTNIIYEFILDIFRNNPQFYTRRPPSDKELDLENARLEAEENNANLHDFRYTNTYLQSLLDSSDSEDDDSHNYYDNDGNYNRGDNDSEWDLILKDYMASKLSS